MERSESPSASDEQKSEKSEQEPRKGSGIRKSVEFADQIEKKHIVPREEDEEITDQIDDVADQIDEETNNMQSDNSDSESEVDIAVKQENEETSSETSSGTLDKPGERKTHPKIARGFKPEIFDDQELTESRVSKRSVSFTPGKMAKSMAGKETARRTTYDGREVTLVTLDTQTDWDWVDSARDSLAGKLITGQEVEAGRKSRDRSDLKSILVKPDSRETTSQSLKTDTTEMSLDDQMATTTPYTPYSDEFGIPILDISTDSDSSDEESNRNSQEDRNLLPSIGPPQILQYIRESNQNDMEVKEPVSQSSEADINVIEYVDEFGRPYGMFGGKCEFCNEQIKPFPSEERQRSMPANELYCCDDYREFVNFATTTAMELEEETKNANKLINIKPHAHFGSKKDRKMAKERAVQRMRERELQRRQQEATGLQQNFYSPKKKKDKVVVPKPITQEVPDPLKLEVPDPIKLEVPDPKKQEVLEPLKLKVLKPIKQEVSKPIKLEVPKPIKLEVPKPKKLDVSKPIKLEVSRQMKTINYQLSSQRCLDEGWTLRPPSPEDNGDEDVEIFIPEPLNPNNMLNRPLIEKFYEDGKKFLTIFPDGSGNVFYPSGQVAILISSVNIGQYIYVVHDDSPNHTVQAVFEPTGYGSCYHHNGNVRLYFDQLGGIELDVHGAKKRKWTWKDPETHVHAPPFQPICIGLNRHIGIRVMSQENIGLSLSTKRRSCRFNVGARLKLVAPENIPPQEVEDSALYLDECKINVQSILDKVTNLLKFPKSPKLDKILPPIHLTSKMQRTERIRREKMESQIGTSTSKTARKGTLPVVSVN